MKDFAVVLAAVLAVALIIRIFVIPRFAESPGKLQALLEAVVGFFSRLAGRRRRDKAEGNELPAEVKAKKKSGIGRAVLIGAAVCIAAGLLISALFPNAPREELHVSLEGAKIDFFGLSISSSVVYTWVMILIVLAVSLALRIFAIPKFSDKPGKLQLLLEAAVDFADDFTQSHVHGLSNALGPYVFTVAVFLVCSAAFELFGFRPPSSDITVTFALSIITFLMINYFGLKHNGLKGRLKQFVRPMPFMVPFKILSDIAVPISLACRLFGNMLGGMIVINLIYMAMNNFSVGVPGVLGLYFSLFHPLIQTFIFLKLSLSFIEEAVD